MIAAGGPEAPPPASASTRVLGVLRVLPLIVLVTGAVSTAAVWRSVERADQRNLELQFEASFERLTRSLQHEISVHILALRGVAGLFGGSERVTGDEFHAYVKNAQLSRHLPGVQAVGYLSAVPASDLARQPDALPIDGEADNRVWPLAGQSYQVSLRYLAPVAADDSRALGFFDQLSEPSHAAALTRAARDSSVMMSPPQRLWGESNHDRADGLVLYLANHCARGGVASVEHAPARLCGWTFIALQINGILDAELPRFESQARVTIIDTHASERDRPVFQSAAVTAGLAVGRYRREAQLQVAGRTWTLSANSLPGYVASDHSRAPAWVLAIGSAITLLMTFVAHLLRRYYRRLTTLLDNAAVIRRQLAASLDQLRLSERSHREMFAANPVPMWVYDLETLRFLAVNDAAIRDYGYSREEFLKMTIMDIRPAEDRPRLHFNLAAVSEGLDDAGLWRHRTRDGRCIDVDIRSSVIKFDGRRAELVIARDVTARLAAEASVLARNQELARFNELMVDREVAMIDLKRQINCLSEQLGTPAPYNLAAIDAGQHDSRRDPGE